MYNFQWSHGLFAIRYCIEPSVHFEILLEVINFQNTSIVHIPTVENNAQQTDKNI
jgi:hypothetical protein